VQHAMANDAGKEEGRKSSDGGGGRIRSRGQRVGIKRFQGIETCHNQSHGAPKTQDWNTAWSAERGTARNDSIVVCTNQYYWHPEDRPRQGSNACGATFFCGSESDGLRRWTRRTSMPAPTQGRSKKQPGKAAIGGWVQWDEPTAISSLFCPKAPSEMGGGEGRESWGGKSGKSWGGCAIASTRRSGKTNLVPVSS
jgi:hypothetical protein